MLRRVAASASHGASSRTARLRKLLSDTGPAVLLLAGLGVATTLPYLANDVDDAYINYRYARSLARGDGYTFNSGERVEGFTSPLWVTAAALPIALGAEDPHRTMQAVGIAFAAATAALLFGLSRRLFAGEPVAWAWLAPLWFLARPNVGFWATSGMETLLYTFLMTLGLFLWLRDGVGARLGACFGVATLTRPEAVVTFGVLLLLTPRAPASLRRMVSAGAAFAVVFGPWLLFRLLYYGQWLPNTFFAKRMGLELSVGTGLYYLGSYLAASAAIPLLAVGLVLWRRRSPFPAVAAVWLASLAAILWTGADWMPRHRFLVHALAFEALLVAGGLHALADVLARGRPRLAAALPALLLVPWLAVQATASWRLVREVDRARPLVQARSRGLGEAIRVRGVGKVALLDAGKIAYFADVPTLDLVGLTNAFIAHSPGAHLHKSYDPRYVLEQRPDVVILRSTGPGRPNPDGRGREFDPRALYPVERRLYLHPGFQRDYAYSQTISLADPPRPRSSYYHVYRRRPGSAPPSDRPMGET